MRPFIPTADQAADLAVLQAALNAELAPNGPLHHFELNVSTPVTLTSECSVTLYLGAPHAHLKEFTNQLRSLVPDRKLHVRFSQGYLTEQILKSNLPEGMELTTKSSLGVTKAELSGPDLPALQRTQQHLEEQLRLANLRVQLSTYQTGQPPLNWQELSGAPFVVLRTEGGMETVIAPGPHEASMLLRRLGMLLPPQGEEIIRAEISLTAHKELSSEPSMKHLTDHFQPGDIITGTVHWPYQDVSDAPVTVDPALQAGWQVELDGSVPNYYHKRLNPGQTKRQPTRAENDHDGSNEAESRNAAEELLFSPERRNVDPATAWRLSQDRQFEEFIEHSLTSGGANRNSVGALEEATSTADFVQTEGGYLAPNEQLNANIQRVIQLSAQPLSAAGLLWVARRVTPEQTDAQLLQLADQAAEWNLTPTFKVYNETAWTQWRVNVRGAADIVARDPGMASVILNAAAHLTKRTPSLRDLLAFASRVAFEPQWRAAQLGESWITEDAATSHLENERIRLLLMTLRSNREAQERRDAGLRADIEADPNLPF